MENYYLEVYPWLATPASILRDLAEWFGEPENPTHFYDYYGRVTTGIAWTDPESPPQPNEFDFMALQLLEREDRERRDAMWMRDVDTRRFCLCESTL